MSCIYRRKLSIRFLIIVQLLFLIGVDCYGYLTPKIKIFEYGLLDFGAAVDFYDTKTNYNESGGTFSPSGSMQLIQTPAFVRYGLGDRWNVNSSVMVSTAQTKNFDASRNNSTFTEVHLGGEYLVLKKSVDVIAEAQLIYPFEDIDTTRDNAMNSEGVMELIGRVQVQQNRESILWYARGGYDYRFEGRSGLVLWDAGAGYKFSAFNLGLEVGGFHSLIDDGDRGQEAARYTYLQRVDGGSYRFYSVNPSVGDVRLWAEAFFGDHTELAVSAGYPFYGQNYSQGLTVSAALTINFDIQESNKSANRISKPKERDDAIIGSEKDVENFQEMVEDGVDQGLFRPEPKPALPVKKPTPVAPKDDLKTRLDDAEMTIKLKAKKKPRRR